MKPSSAAFTLRELIVLLATLAILAILYLPSHANFRIAGQRASCLDNLRQLSGAWILYTEDNTGKLVGNLDGMGTDAWTNLTWAAGWLALNQPRTDNTNWVKLMKSLLGPYVDSHVVFKCPADLSYGPVAATGLSQPRVRSYSMNSYLGDRPSPYTAGYRQFRHINDITDPAPARLFVFLDEREDSINDAAFFIDMDGFDPRQPDRYKLVDFPAERHNRAGNFAFADGHTETWRWQDSRTTPIRRTGQPPPPLNPTVPNNPDVARIQAATSRRVVP